MHEHILPSLKFDGKFCDIHGSERMLRNNLVYFMKAHFILYYILYLKYKIWVHISKCFYRLFGLRINKNYGKHKREINIPTCLKMRNKNDPDKERMFSYVNTGKKF